MDSAAIAERIETTSGIDGRERMLEQELLLALDSVARREPALLKGSLTLQLGQLMLLLTSELAVEKTLTQDEAFEALCSEAPHAIRKRCAPCSPMWTMPEQPCNAANSCT